jgi:hypothetical protein
MIEPFRQPRQRGVVVGDDTFGVPVVGTLQHQMTIGAIAAARSARGHGRYCAALLASEPSGVDGSRLVFVRINGLEVGHLESELAQSFERALATKGYTDAACEAEIVGSWKRHDDQEYVGVRLNAKLPFQVVPAGAYPPATR